MRGGATSTRAEPLRLKAARAGVPVLYKPLDTALLKRFIAEAAR